MSVNYSESELLKFLDYLSAKGLLSSSTASGRKAACLKVLSALDPDEKVDLRNIDREQTFQRFSNKFGKEFTPQSLVTYKSRLNAALNDFFKYQENPAGFKVGSGKKSSKETSSEGKSTPKRADIRRTNKTPPPPPPPPDGNQSGSYVLQIPISKDRLIEIRNMPMDLTAEDATKIAGIITAHAPTKGIKTSG